MIDAGYNYAGLKEKMSWIDIDPSTIGHILITHQDTDHVGALERDSDLLFKDATVYIGEIENRYLTGEVRRKVFHGAYKLPLVKMDNRKTLLKDGNARLFASWGVDYLKYDNGYCPATMTTPLLYRRMAAALRSTGRDILLAACQWGTDNVYQWIRSSGAQTFRSTIDIRDDWESITAIALSQIGQQCFNGPDCFNDMDMLVVGMNGQGMNPETTSGVRVGCTEEEYRTHFALWAMMGSPLIIGCDIRSMDPETKRILTNQDLIRINQDPECRSCYQLPVYARDKAFCLVRVLQQGEIAVGLYNFSDKEETESVMLWDLGIPVSEEIIVSVYDCFSKERIPSVKEILETTVPAHGCRVFLLTAGQN